jgi:hypothetical protein
MDGSTGKYLFQTYLAQSSIIFPHHTVTSVSAIHLPFQDKYKAGDGYLIKFIRQRLE